MKHCSTMKTKFQEIGQYNKKWKQITIQNISENITSCFWYECNNALTCDSQRNEAKNNAVAVSPKKSNYGRGMHSKNISWCLDSDGKTEELDDSDCAQRNKENFSDDSSRPPSPSPKKQTVQKNLPLLKKVPSQSYPSVKKRNQCAKQKKKKMS